MKARLPSLSMKSVTLYLFVSTNAISHSKIQYKSSHTVIAQDDCFFNYMKSNIIYIYMNDCFLTRSSNKDS